MTHLSNFEFVTKDGFTMSVFVENSHPLGGFSRVIDGSLFGHWESSFIIRGRDSYEVLKAEGKHMTKDEIKRMFQ